jgi:hypothetical protein
MTRMTAPADVDRPAPGPAAPRWWLWIDGVGGYLVCEANDVTLGQPAADGSVDVPILGDVSRRHAQLRRAGEAYLLEPWRPVRVDGRTIDRTCTMSRDTLIEMGEGVRLRFRQPHPYSATARLDFVSRHRTHPSADAVLLMADACILGPGESAHVQCPRLSGEVLLFRQGNDLRCRATGGLEIDGVRYPEVGPLTRSSRVVGREFSFGLEPG